MKSEYIYLICRDYEPPCFAVLTEADAEELLMDLVMECQYENFLWALQCLDLSLEECYENEIIKSNGGYYITRALKAF